MSAQPEVKYVYQTVQAVRGLEARAIAKQEALGWELVEQSTGRLSTGIKFRRVKADTPFDKATAWFKGTSTRTKAVIGGVAALVVLGIVGAGASGGGDDNKRVAADPTSTPTVTTEPTPTETPTPTPTPPPVEPDIITAKSTPAFAKLLKGGECDDAIATFAQQYAGHKIQFDGAIVAMANHGSYKTRFDLLLAAGKFSTTEQHGPQFHITDKNLSYDMHFENAPDRVGVGDSFTFVAEVGEYIPETCLLELTPVSSTYRG